MHVVSIVAYQDYQNPEEVGQYHVHHTHAFQECNCLESRPPVKTPRFEANAVMVV